MEPNPGPIDRNVLYLQDQHRSESVFAGDNSTVRLRRCETLQHNHVHLDPRLIAYLQRTGFYGFRRIGFMQVDSSLITALLERWRQETHTFHLPVGECTITLQDVEVLLGLPVDGKPVTCATQNIIWEDLCARLLGKVPPKHMIKGGRVKYKWFRHEFTVIPDGADELTLDQYARAYLFMLITGSLFTDVSGSWAYLSFLPLLENLDEIQTYSWGSAALSWLYRHLCNASAKGATQMGGCVILMQLWAFEHISFTSPGIRGIPQSTDWQLLPLGYRWSQGERNRGENSSHVLSIFRFQLDSLIEKHMIWNPYTEDILAHLPEYCYRGRDIWRAKVPLICFSVVEWHAPDRVLRQFGLLQDIPETISTEPALHLHSLTSKINWNIYHERYIEIWNDRINRIVLGGGEDICMYMDWYKQITRKFMTRKCLINEYMQERMQQIYNVAGDDVISGYTHGAFIQSICKEMSRHCHEFALGTRAKILPILAPPTIEDDGIEYVEAPRIADSGDLTQEVPNQQEADATEGSQQLQEQEHECRFSGLVYSKRSKRNR